MQRIKTKLFVFQKGRSIGVYFQILGNKLNKRKAFCIFSIQSHVFLFRIVAKISFVSCLYQRSHIQEQISPRASNILAPELRIFVSQIPFSTENPWNSPIFHRFTPGPWFPHVAGVSESHCGSSRHDATRKCLNHRSSSSSWTGTAAGDLGVKPRL